MIVALAYAQLLLVAAPPPILDYAAVHDGSPRVVLIGDTGSPGPIVDRWRKSLLKQPKDAIVVLGDLVYDQAPPCPKGVPDLGARRVLESHLAAALEGLGAPAFLAIGNHDTSWDRGDPPREKCIVEFVKSRADLKFPAPYYAVDFGVAMLVVLNSNALDDAQAEFVKKAFSAARPRARKILAAHHVLKTYHDKIGEDLIRPWLKKHDLAPDLWLNGHAHLLQLGIYDGIVAVTSGTGALPRERPACHRSATDDEGCGEGQLFGSSVPGYVWLDIAPNGRFSLTFADADGQTLFRWDEGGLR